MNLPNKITLFRIALVPFLWLSMYGCFFLEFSWLWIVNVILFMLASISDFLDGYIARKYQLITSLGKFLDPIADKLLVNTSLIILSCFNFVPLICTLLMISRDILVDALRMHVAKQGVVVSAKLLGKLKTVFQMIGLLFIFANFHLIGTILIWIATVVSLLSGLQYGYRLRKYI